MFALCLAVGCKAQTSASPAPDLALNRHIEVMVRSKFSVPEDYTVILGTRKPSPVAGYDTLPVTLSRGTRVSQVEFLISTDNKTLARLETWSLVKDPAFA